MSKNSSYSRTRLANYIAAEMNSDTDLTVLSDRVAAYLIDNGKTSELESLMRDAQELRAQKYGIVEFTARSVHQLDKVQKKQIEQIAVSQYKKTTKVTMHSERDESVVGGTNLIFPNMSFDISVRAKLNRLKEAVQ